VDHGLDTGDGIQITADLVLAHIVAVHGIFPSVGVVLGIPFSVQIAQSVPLIIPRGRGRGQFINDPISPRVQYPGTEGVTVGRAGIDIPVAVLKKVIDPRRVGQVCRRIIGNGCAPRVGVGSGCSRWWKRMSIIFGRAG